MALDGDGGGIQFPMLRRQGRQLLEYVSPAIPVAMPVRGKGAVQLLRQPLCPGLETRPVQKGLQVFVGRQCQVQAHAPLSAHRAG